MAQNFTEIQLCTEVTKEILRDNFMATASTFSGSGFPSNPYNGQLCIRTDTVPWTLHVYKSATASWIALTTITISAEPLAEFIAALADDTDPVKGAGLLGYKGRTVHNRLSNIPCLLDYDADPSGANDSTSALVAAIADSKVAGSNAVLCSGGKFTIDTGAVAIDNVSLFSMSPPDFGPAYANNGCTFQLTSQTTTPFILGLGWRIEGITFYYPEQDGTDAVPLVYPPLFTGTYTGGSLFSNVTILNAYDAFQFQDGTAVGDLRFPNCRIYAIRRTFEFLGGAPEVINIIDGIFSYGVFIPSHAPNTYMRDYTVANGEFIRVDVGASGHPSIDGLNVHDCIVYGYRYGMRVVSGGVNIANIHDNDFDMVPTALSIEGTSYMSNCRINNNFFWSGKIDDLAAAYNTIDISSSSSATNLYIGDGNDFAYSQGNHLYWSAIGMTDLQIGGSRFKSWGRTTSTPATTYYAINATSATMNGSIRGASFKAFSGAEAHNKNGIGIGNALDMSIQGNEFDDCYLSLWTINGTNIKVMGNESTGTTWAASFKNDCASGVVKSLGNLWDKGISGPSGISHVIAKASSQTFSGVKTQAVFGSEIIDRDGNFSANTFTAPINGLYEFKALLTNANGCTIGDVWTISIEQSGSDVVAFATSEYVPATSYGSASLQVNASMYLAAGDLVRVYVARSYGTGTYVTLNDGTFNTFSAKRIIE